MVVILVALTFFAFMVIVPLVRKAVRDKRAYDDLVAHDANSTPTLPFEYRLTPGHLWLYVTTAGTVKIGIDELVRRFLGQPDYLQLKGQGDRVKKGDVLVVIRRGNREIHLNSPIDGTVVRSNTDLIMTPERLAKDPYRDGWLYVVEPATSLVDLPGLRVAERARMWLSEEFGRLKDFVQSNLHQPSLAGQTLADGGTLAEALIRHLDQGAVERFEREFLHDSRPTGN